MQVAENATRKLHFLIAFCEYASVNFEPRLLAKPISFTNQKLFYTVAYFRHDIRDSCLGNAKFPGYFYLDMEV